MDKQFNIKGKNGLYLSYVSPIQDLSAPEGLDFSDSNSVNYFKYHLIENYDFFPRSRKEANLFDLKNVKYDSVNLGLIGSNAISKSNSSLKFSQIFRTGQLILNKKYYNTFKLYFKFTGSDLGSYIYPGFTNNDLTIKVFNALRVKFYIQLGTNLVPLKLDNLQKFNGTTWVNVTNSDKSGTGDIANSSGSVNGIQKTVGNNSEECIDMRYTTASPLTNLFTTLSPDGYTFRVDARSDYFRDKTLKNQEYKIIIKYFNIGVAGTPTLFQTSETIELMSSNFIYYQQVFVPKYTYLNFTNTGTGSMTITLPPGGGST